MTRSVAAVVVIAGLSFAAAPRLGAQAVHRALYVSVVDEAGAPVLDLGTTDFIVREDNVAREVLSVQPADEPMQVALLVDTSAAAQESIQHLRTALPSFVTALTGGASGVKHQVAIIAFGERPQIFTDFTTSAADLQKGINRIWATPGSGAYLLDAIEEVIKGFKKRETKRPVIVAITVEGIEFSSRHYDHVLGPMRDSGAPFYALMLGQPSGSVSEEARSRNIVLDQGTRDTGGARVQLLTPMALDGRLKQLASQLTHQYLVTYSHPQSLIPPDRVTVSSPKPGLTARGTLVKERKEPQAKP